MVVVGFAAADSLAHYQRRQGLDHVLVLSDPDRLSYRAFGFGRGSVLRVWADPRVWRRYAGLLRRGHRLEAAHQDTLQLGGDVLVDADARILWVYRSRGPENRPGLDEISAELTRNRPGAPP